MKKGGFCGFDYKLSGDPKFEISQGSNEKERDYFKEALVVIPIIFGVVALFGLFADKVLGSEEKARDARKHGYDV